jgi:hypothetical protein
MAPSRCYGEHVSHKSLRLSTIAVLVQHRYHGPVRKHECIFFTGDAHYLLATIEGYPGWVVGVDLLETDGGPAITELHVFPFQEQLAQESEGGMQHRWRRLDGTWTPPKWAPLEETGRMRWSHDPADLPAGVGISARLIRSINTGELLALARQCAQEEHAKASAQAELLADRIPEWSEYLRKVAAASEALAGASKRTGRRGNGIDHYLQWAVRYAEKVRDGERHPNVALAAEWADSGVTRTYVRDTITDARRRYGLLTKPGQGLAGGDLTEKAILLLSTRQLNQGDGHDGR